jgi:SAM-dependent methyltransferase
MLKNLYLRKAVFLGTLFAFLGNGWFLPPAYAQKLILPFPGTMVHLSSAFNPPILKGIKAHPENPFRFDFILDKGESQLSNTVLKNESSKLIRYFLASLTIPQKDLWVNLSPYEKDRIVPEAFGQTEMGRDLLAEDYILKQITASLIYPEDEVGKQFWKKIYEEAAKKFGTTHIPINTFNKVWIIPEKAVVYENPKSATAYIVEAKLKILTEADYWANKKNNVKDNGQNEVIKEILIPHLTKEINEGRNFAQLRQVYNSLILATWYKKKIKDSILAQVYNNKNKTAGLKVIPVNAGISDAEIIYQRYLKAFKNGVYNLIKEEPDPITQQSIPRKYFSGGFIADEVHIDLAMRTATLREVSTAVNGTNSKHIYSLGIKINRVKLSHDVAMICPICGSKSLSPFHHVILKGVRLNFVRCAHCETVFMDPLPNKEWLKSVYDKDFFSGSMQGGYANYGAGADEQKRIERVRSIMQQILKLNPPSGRWLDIGPGYGHLLNEAKSHGWEAIGLDVSAHVVETVETRFRIPVIQGAVDEGVLDHEKSFEVISMIDSLEHVLDPVDTLRRVHEKLSKDGVLVVHIPALDSVRAIEKGKSFLLPVHIFNFDSSSLKSLLEREGFKVEFSRLDRIHVLIIARKAIPAMASVRKPGNEIRRITSTGGINLTSDKALSLQNNDLGIKFHIDPAELARWQSVPGVTFDINDIQPRTDLCSWLGLPANIH